MTPTSQQLAERIAYEVLLGLYQSGVLDCAYDHAKILIPKVLEKSPIVELIEVARAAVAIEELRKANFGDTMTNYNRLKKEMQTALTNLKSKGVEL